MAPISQPVTRPPRPPPRAPGGRAARFAAALGVVAMIGVVIYVVHEQSGASHASDPREPFDPQLTNRDELRRVTEAISRVIAAPAEDHANAVETLESLRVESPGARDLQESCVNTYRPVIRAQEIQAQLRATLLLPDGGERPTSSLTPGEVNRVSPLLQEAQEQVELAHSSEDRCYELYGDAVRLLHLTPAQRPTPPR